jgi:hypothetical protein
MHTIPQVDHSTQLTYGTLTCHIMFQDSQVSFLCVFNWLDLGLTRLDFTQKLDLQHSCKHPGSFTPHWILYIKCTWLPNLLPIGVPDTAVYPSNILSVSSPETMARTPHPLGGPLILIRVHYTLWRAAGTLHPLEGPLILIRVHYTLWRDARPISNFRVWP